MKPWGPIVRSFCSRAPPIQSKHGLPYLSHASFWGKNSERATDSTWPWVGHAITWHPTQSPTHPKDPGELHQQMGNLFAARISPQVLPILRCATRPTRPEQGVAPAIVLRRIERLTGGRGWHVAGPLMLSVGLETLPSTEQCIKGQSGAEPEEAGQRQLGSLPGPPTAPTLPPRLPRPYAPMWALPTKHPPALLYKGGTGTKQCHLNTRTNATGTLALREKSRKMNPTKIN